MSARSFVDTNVLVYAHDLGAGVKHERARGLVRTLWEQRTGVISTQVLQELYVNLRRKASRPVSHVEARRLIDDYLTWEVIVNDGTAVLDAIDLEHRHRLSFWDALIVRAATVAGVKTMYSEDLSNGQVYGEVQVVNPLL